MFKLLFEGSYGQSCLKKCQREIILTYAVSTHSFPAETVSEEASQRLDVVVERRRVVVNVVVAVSGRSSLSTRICQVKPNSFLAVAPEP